MSSTPGREPLLHALRTVSSSPTVSERYDVAAALARAADELMAAQDSQATLQAIVAIAQKTLDGVDEAGISLVDDTGRAEPVVGTGPLVWQLGAVEARLRQGPCREVIDGAAGGVVVLDDVPGEQRWPRYLRRAQHLGLRAQVAVGVSRGDQLEGVLSLYATGSDELGNDVAPLAEAFAQLAAAALAQGLNPN